MKDLLKEFCMDSSFAPTAPVTTPPKSCGSLSPIATPMSKGSPAFEYRSSASKGGFADCAMRSKDGLRSAENAPEAVVSVKGCSSKQVRELY